MVLEQAAGLDTDNSPALHYGDGSQSARGEASQVAPAFWAPSGVDIVPERSERSLRCEASGMPSVLRPQGGAFKGEL